MILHKGYFLAKHPRFQEITFNSLTHQSIISYRVRDLTNRFFEIHSWTYYATFKVKNFESLFYKINTRLKKTTTCLGLRVEQILLVNIYYIYFSILSVAFAVPFLCYFQKLQLLVIKRFWIKLCCIVLLFLWAQKPCLKFLKSYFKLEILISLSLMVSFLVDMFN